MAAGCSKVEINFQVLPGFHPNYLLVFPPAIQGNKLVYPVFLRCISSRTQVMPLAQTTAHMIPL